MDKVVTLCGSKKFFEDFFYYEKKWEDKGYLVFLPDSFNIPNNFEMSSDQIKTLHKIHETKMLASEIVLFVNNDGYIGEDTLRELQFCVDNNLNVRFTDMKYSVSDYIKDGGTL